MADVNALIENISSWRSEGDGRFFFSADEFEMIISALRKQSAEKPVCRVQGIRYYFCPECGEQIADGHRYCGKCGQMIFRPEQIGG